MLFVRVLALPADSALAVAANDGRMPWSTTDHLLADLWALQARAHGGKKAPKQHPGRPRPKAKPMTAAKAEKYRTAQRRRQQIRDRRQQPQLPPGGGNTA
ncbi:hypothetical protein SKPI104516_15470 [Skermania piniformis]